MPLSRGASNILSNVYIAVHIAPSCPILHSSSQDVRQPGLESATAMQIASSRSIQRGLCEQQIDSGKAVGAQTVRPRLQKALWKLPSVRAEVTVL